MPKTNVNIQRLKDFSFTEIPRDWVLRDLILSERNELDVIEFIVKIETWLKLAQEKKS